jgi:hypothetical protein
MGLMGAAASAAAAPIPYVINFTTTSGSPSPAAGGFQFDAATNLFSGFTVTWNQVVFDFTSQANLGQVTGACANTSPGTLQVFNFLIGINDCGGRTWTGLADTACCGLGILAKFNIEQGVGFQEAFFINTGDNSRYLASGTFIATPSQVPEPTTLPLLLSGGVALVAWKRRRVRNQRYLGTGKL